MHVTGPWRTAAFAEFSRFRSAAVNLLFPLRCCYCGRETEAAPENSLICGSCQSRLFPATGRVCPRCAMPSPTLPEDATDCPLCRRDRLRFDAATALGFYRGDLRDAVLLMKKAKHENLTLAIAGVLADRLYQVFVSNKPDLAVPVPMHWMRRMIRGVNAPELLIDVLRRRFSLPEANGLLRCRRKTKKQGMLGPSERVANVRGAFAASRAFDIRGAKIMLVDDVMTTGATANELARVCRRAGAESVFVAVVARGIGQEFDPSGIAQNAR